ncbi:MAG: hypothetical protein AAB400_03715 [Patescibacteria group bacterium]
MPPSLVSIFEKITDLLTHSLGFSQSGAQRQLTELEKIIMGAIIRRMAEERGVSLSSLQSQKKLEAFFETFSDEKKLKNIIEHESTRVLKEYFSTVTAGLDTRKRAQFYSTLQSIVGVA